MIYFQDEHFYNEKLRIKVIEIEALQSMKRDK